MKLAILYTSHRQWEELDFAPAFYERTTRLRGQFDLLFHCNNPAINETELRAKLEKIPAKSLFVRVAPSKNLGGYVYGQFEAMSDTWDHVDLTQWDWIIHLHPDLFIADENKLLAAIEAADKAGAQVLVSHVFGLWQPAFASDCFAFKPVPAMRAAFDGYRPLLATPTRVPTETLLFIEIHRAGVKYFISDRFLHGHYHREIDRWGIWHEHDLRRVAAYLRKPSSRWWYTVGYSLRFPLQLGRILADWIRRKIYKRPQDGLPQLLSRIEPPE